MTTEKTIEFWFDFISPYAYLAWHRIHPVAERHGRVVAYRPVLFAGLLNHWGQLGPAEIPPKRTFTFKQVVRRAHALGVPLSPPPTHPFNPLLALRIVSLTHEPSTTRRVIDALFTATWGGGGTAGIADPGAVAELLDGLGLDGQAVIAEASAPDNKRRLLESGERAIASGVFGVPTMIADGELFWGDDTVADLDRFLAGEDPVDPASLERWRDLPVGSDRRG